MGIAGTTPSALNIRRERSRGGDAAVGYENCTARRREDLPREWPLRDAERQAPATIIKVRSKVVLQLEEW